MENLGNTSGLTVGRKVVCENGVSFLSCAAVIVECIGDILFWVFSAIVSPISSYS